MSERKHDGKPHIWGGAEGQLQRREKEEAEAERQEWLTSGIVIDGDSNRA
jgi:hypothetical protein